MTIAFTNISTEFYKLQSGYLYHYAYSILIGFSILLGLKDFQTLFEKFIELKLLILMISTLFFVNIAIRNAKLQLSS